VTNPTYLPFIKELSTKLTEIFGDVKIWKKLQRSLLKCLTQMLFQIKHTILELIVGVTVFYKPKCGGESAACMIPVDSS
jgi:hypothetical protein